MNKSSKSVATVVVTYNRKELLLKCINAIIKQTFPVDKIYIVNNGSTDGTFEYLEAHKIFEHPAVKWHDLGENLGGAGGFHYGIKEAFENRHDWIWVMDDDTIPLPDALENLLRFAEKNSQHNIGALLSYQTNWEPSSLHYRLPDTIFEALKYYTACQINLNGQSDQLVAIDWFPFVSFLVPRTAVEKVGFPLKDIFIYGDDQEYAFRLGEKGYKMFLVTDSKVDHLTGRKVEKKKNTKSDWRWYYTYRNQIALIKLHRKHIGELKALAALLRLSSGAVWRMVTSIITGNISLVKLVCRGLIHGHLVKMGKTVSP